MSCDGLFHELMNTDAFGCGQPTEWSISPFTVIFLPPVAEVLAPVHGARVIAGDGKLRQAHALIKDQGGIFFIISIISALPRWGRAMAR